MNTLNPSELYHMNSMDLSNNNKSNDNNSIDNNSIDNNSILTNDTINLSTDNDYIECNSTQKRKNNIIDDDYNKKKKINTDEYDKYIEGICCFCGNECNEMSQSCGKCARQHTMRMFGWNV